MARTRSPYNRPQIGLKLSKEADEKDQLYGSISKKEIVDFLQNNNLKVRSDDVIIKEQMKSIGEHPIQINPYEGINEEVFIIVNKMQVFMESRWIPLPMPNIDKNTFDLKMQWSDNMNSYDLL